MANQISLRVGILILGVFLDFFTNLLYAIVIHIKGNTMSTTSVISVRVSDNERHLLGEAAGKARTNLSDYVRRQALDAAEMLLMTRSVVKIPADRWEELEAWLDRPAKANANLTKLAQTKPAWE